MHINDLPEEVLLLVIENCTAKDLTTLAHTCSHFAKIMKLDIIWKKLYKKKYDMEDLGNVESYYRLYSGLLHNHGWMIGLFWTQKLEYDGFLEVKCSGGVIQGLQVTYPVGKKVILEIEIDQKDPKCLRYPLTCHRAKIRRDHIIFPILLIIDVTEGFHINLKKNMDIIEVGTICSMAKCIQGLKFLMENTCLKL